MAFSWRRLVEGGGWGRRGAWIALGTALVVACGVVRHYAAPQQASADPPVFLPRPRTAAPASRPAAAAAKYPEIVASVNRQQISLQAFSNHALRYYGEEVLESLVNRRLISLKCQQLGIEITRQEVEQEVVRMAERFKLPPDRWLQMLQEERHISPAQYKNDIVWPMIALRKLAASQLEVGEAELRQAYESEYGPSVKVRLIATTAKQKAEQVRAAAAARPDEFGNLAKEHSEDAYSASVKGLIQPIRLHLGDKTLEKVAFGLKENQISPVIQVGPQFVILKCEGHLPDHYQSVPFDARTKAALAERLKEQKLRTVADGLFRKLQQEAEGKIDIVYADPKRRDEMPGVAAIVHGQQITIRELGEACLDRYGQELLAGLIHRTLIEQAVAAKQVPITEADIDEEIARAAVAMGKVDDRGRPDVAGWLEVVTKEQGLALPLYRADVVWPTVALKALVGGTVEVTDEDLKKGFEANYGPRVKCRAIVLNSQRRAQEVWDLARRNPTAEQFGLLAEQYSVEASSRALRGEVPPVQLHGGRPSLEKEAFSLKPGELSSIVQVGDKYVILLCEGQTQPVQVRFADVKQILIDEIHEKKLRAKMAEFFARLEENAYIDNFLAGTSQSPQPKSGQPKSGAPTAVTPAVAPAGKTSAIRTATKQ